MRSLVMLLTTKVWQKPTASGSAAAGHTGWMADTARIRLASISSRAWEHPADRGALVALRKLHGFDVILRQLSGFLNERAVRMMLLGSAVRADHRQFARVYRLYREAGDALTPLSCPSCSYVPIPPSTP